MRPFINAIAYRLCGRWVTYPPLPRDGRILFFERDRRNFEFLSNMHGLHPIELDGEVWATVEHYYQSRKSTSKAYRKTIQMADCPKAAKDIGSKKKRHGWFHSGKDPQDLREDWNEVKLGVMRTALQAKFTQIEIYRRALLATGDAEIIEDSRADAFWGWGRPDQQGNYHGQNQMGQLLMDLRVELACSA